MKKAYSLTIIYTIAGAIFGFLLFHPYSMLVNHLTGIDKDENTFGGHIHDLFSVSLSTFKPEMVFMAASYAVLGGVIGLLAGTLLDKKRKLTEIEHENEKKKIALETIQKLTMTLSHYLLNANVVIGGMTARCIKKETDQEIVKYLDIVIKEAGTIDAVIAALRKITLIRTEGAYSKDDNLMIDIADEIKEELKILAIGTSEESRGNL